MGIDALVVIGGNGSQQAHMKSTSLAIPSLGLRLPSTMTSMVLK